MAKLDFLNGPRKGELLEIPPGGVTIGRETDNDIQLLIGGVSRYHAKIERNPAGKWRVSDLDSTNGTVLNGNPVTGPMLLHDGDCLEIGEQRLRFNSDPAPVPVLGGELPPDPPRKKKPQVIFHTSVPAQEKKPVPASVPAEETPKTDPVPVPEEKKEPHETEKKAEPKPVIEDLFGKKNDGIFSAGAVPERRPRRGNILFTIGVVGVAVIAVSLFLILFPNQETRSGADVRKIPLSERNPFFLHYEKQVVSRDNVFRFSLRIENNTAVFMLDDLKPKRHFVRRFGEVNKEYLKTLLSSIKETEFMKLEQEAGSPSRSDGVDEIRTLTISYGPNLNSITVHNNYPKSSFEMIEMAIDRFADDYGLKTVSFSSEDMRAEAEKAFAKAEELLGNYLARPENLRNAILRYNLAVELLEQFEPPPKELEIALKHRKEAEDILQKLIRDASTNINILYRRKQYAEAAAECRKLMEYLEPDSKAYQSARSYKIKLERLVDNKKR